MDQRMKDLIGQAKFMAEETVNRKIPYDIGLEAFAEKFAELIVQRTLEIVDAHTEIFQSDQARAMVEHIKHSVKTDFGVES